MAPLITACSMIIRNYQVLFKERRSKNSKKVQRTWNTLLSFLQHIWQFGCCSHCHDFCVCEQAGLWGNQDRGTDPFSVLSLVLQHESSQHCGTLQTKFLNIFTLYLSSGMHKMWKWLLNGSISFTKEDPTCFCKNIFFTILYSLNMCKDVLFLSPEVFYWIHMLIA